MRQVSCLVDEAMKSQSKDEIEYLLQEYGAEEYLWIDNDCRCIDVVFDKCVIRYVIVEESEEKTVFFFGEEDYLRKHRAISVSRGGYAGEG